MSGRPAQTADFLYGGGAVSIKIRISYTEDEELAGVIRLLSPLVKSWKKSGSSKGKYKRAYVELKEAKKY